MSDRRDALASSILKELYFWSQHVEIPKDILVDHYHLFMHPADYSLLLDFSDSNNFFQTSYFGPKISLTEFIEPGEVVINQSNSFSGQCFNEKKNSINSSVLNGLVIKI